MVTVKRETTTTIDKEKPARTLTVSEKSTIDMNDLTVNQHPEVAAIKCKDRLHEIVKDEVENEDELLEWKEGMATSFSRMDKEVTKWSEVNQTMASSSSTITLPKNYKKRSLELMWDKLQIIWNPEISWTLH
ncbi:hypothetical protein L2E82_52628 [Cichorium intybus]|nr:hypothetical protein L2E82_52628 [Cichorium intybus]